MSGDAVVNSVHSHYRVEQLELVELEVTGRCQEQCEHCYALSTPNGAHGTMNTREWRSVISQATMLGVPMVQFIGGEPTTRPDLAELIGHALDCGLAVEVYTNLFRITPALWETFTRPGVRLATSYYSADPTEHDRVTGRPGSQSRTRANITESLRRGIKLRVGIIHVRDTQQVAMAHADLAALGVEHVRVDRVRQVGRAERAVHHDPAELCGRCARGRVAISPDGLVWPCVMARWMPLGNVKRQALAEILAGPGLDTARSRIPAPPTACQPQCGPHHQPVEPTASDVCDPYACTPDRCQPDDTDDCDPAHAPCRPSH